MKDAKKEIKVKEPEPAVQKIELLKQDHPAAPTPMLAPKPVMSERG